MQQIVSTLVQDGESAVLMCLQAGEVESRVPVLVNVPHIQFVGHDRGGQEIWGEMDKP